MDKAELCLKRKEFFQHILDSVNRSPSETDVFLSQDKYYIVPHKDETFFDAETGDLVISIKGSFFDISFSLWYSMWQFGDVLKVGIAIYEDDFQGIFIDDEYNEKMHLWGKNSEPRIDPSHDGIFFEWEFNVPDLYRGYEHQEKYIIGMRHMHFRAMRIMYDACQKMFVNKRDDVY